MKVRKPLPLGHYNAYVKNVRLIKRIEDGKAVVRLETTYYIKDYGDYTYYTQALKVEE